MHSVALRKLSAVCLGAPLAALVIGCLVIAGDGLTDKVELSDVAVVLGSKVYPDGRPSARLAARLDRALELYRDGDVARVIVSGGTGAEGFDEARVMKSYLIARGVPDNLILQDGAGVTTDATARNSALLMRKNGLKTAIVVTQYFHISRATLALRKAGVLVNGTAHARIFEPRDFYSLPREVVGYAVYAAR